MNIFDEIRYLAKTDQETTGLINKIESKCMPHDQLLESVVTVWKSIAPVPPENKRYARNSFWQQCTEKVIHWGMFGHMPGAKAKWLSEQRMRYEAKNEAYPPEAHFEPIPNIPQVQKHR